MWILKRRKEGRRVDLGSDTAMERKIVSGRSSEWVEKEVGEKGFYVGNSRGK